MSRARQIHDTDSADVSALHAHGGYFPLTVFCKNGDITNPELSGGKMPDAGRNMIHVSKKSAQKTHTPDLQGNTKSIVITPAFPDKFFIRFIKMKITRQLKFIGFASEPAITLNLLSGQKSTGISASLPDGFFNTTATVRNIINYQT